MQGPDEAGRRRRRRPRGANHVGVPAGIPAPDDTAPGGAPTGGTAPGDRTAGRTTPGGATPSGTAPGDRTAGRTTPGDRAPGSAAPGRSVSGNRASGRSAAGDAALSPPTPDAERTRRDDPARAGRRQPGEARGDRGLRSLVGAGPSQLGVSGALRGRDVNRPGEDDLAAAERDVVIVRRNWQPPT